MHPERSGRHTAAERGYQEWRLADVDFTHAFNRRLRDFQSEERATTTGAHLDGQRVTLAANGNAHIVAARIHGQQGVDIAARGNLLVEAAQETRSSSHEHQESGFGLHAHFVSGRMRPLSLGTATARHADEAETARSVASRIESAQGPLNITGGLDVAVLGSALLAGSDIKLAGGNLLVVGGLETTKGKQRDEARIPLVKGKDGIDEEWRTTTVVPGELRAAGQAVFSAPTGGVTLGAVGIQSGAETVLDTPRASLVAEKNADYRSRAEHDQDILYQVRKGHGNVTETLTLAKIDARGGIRLPETISVQLDGHRLDPGANAAAQATGTPPAVSPEQFKNLARQISLQPGMAYLAELAKRPDIDWQAVSTAHQQWNYKQQGLTQEGAVILTVVVGILTWGAGSAAVGTTASAAGGGTVTTVAGTTLATTTAAGATTYTALGAALNAGFSSLASTAAVSLVNNGGDLGKTLNDLGSSESIKGTVAAMLTAGVASNFGKIWSLDRLIAQTATGCAAGEITGAGCKQGATTAAILGGLAWGADYFRQDQIENSKQFKGICLGNTGQCENNLTKPSVGVNGDNIGLGGGRWDVVGICRTEGFECRVDNGIVRVFGYGVQDAQGLPSRVLEDAFKQNSISLTLLSPMGGTQGGGGYLKLFGWFGPGFYEKGSFWDKWVVEPFSGTHDRFNSPSSYDTVNEPNYKAFQVDINGKTILRDGKPIEVLAPRYVGNIRPDYGWSGAIMNAIDIPLASPFALATIVDQLPPGTLQVLNNTIHKQTDRLGGKP